MKIVREQWPVFAISALIGVALSLLLPIKRIAQLIQSFLLSQPVERYFGAFLITIAILIICFPRISKWWFRYLKTKQLPCPPIIPVDLALVAVASFLSSCNFLLGISISDAFRSLGSPRSDYALSFCVLLITWALLSLLFGPYVTARHKLTTSSHATEFFDEPITEIKQDILGRAHFVQRLAEQIKALPFTNPFVYGLHASWGQGKTSTLNLLRAHFENDRSFILVNFNPWFLSSPVALTNSFYMTLQQTIDAEYLTYGLHGLIKRYRTILSEGLRHVGLLESTIPDDPGSVRQELEMWLKRAGCRLLVIVDDIDRLTPEEMLATFKVTALTARFQNVLFLLAFDDHIVIRSLDRIGVESSYLGKVIQQAISLPPAEQEDIDRFLLMSDPPAAGNHRSAIDILFDQLRIPDDERQAFDKEIVPSYATKLKLLFTTLRDCKRFVNNLRGTLPALYREVNLYDFVLLEMLHVFAPTVYKDIWANYFVYLPHWSHEVMLVDWLGLYLKEQERSEAIKNHVQTMLAKVPHKEVIQFILEELFPERVEKAFSPMGGGATEGSARAERRLTHPACFQKYFLYRLAKNDLPDALVLGLLDDCNREEEIRAEEHFKQQLSVHLKDGNFIKIIEKLVAFSGRVSPERVGAIIRAISSIAHEINSVTDDFWRSELSRAELYVARLLDENAESINCTNILEEVIANTQSILFMVLLVHTVVSGRERFTRIRSVVDPNSLRELAGARLKTHYVDGERDIFAELPDSRNWVSVLSQWGKNWDGDNSRTRTTVTEYILGLFERNPYYVGIFLERFVEKDFPSGAGFKFNIEYLKQFADHNEIWNRAKAAGLTKACKTENQRNAFRMFEGLSVPRADEETAS